MAHGWNLHRRGGAVREHRTPIRRRGRTSRPSASGSRTALMRVGRDWERATNRRKVTAQLDAALAIAFDASRARASLPRLSGAEPARRWSPIGANAARLNANESNRARVAELRAVGRRPEPKAKAPEPNVLQGATSVLQRASTSERVRATRSGRTDESPWQPSAALLRTPVVGTPRSRPACYTCERNERRSAPTGGIRERGLGRSG